MDKHKAIPQGYMTIGEVAKKMDVTVRTLQHYDREGLLSPSAMSEGGRRLYTDKDIVKLHQILSLKHLGFSLDDIKNRLIPLDTPAEIAAVLTEQAAAIKQKIDSLSESLRELEVLREEVLQMQSVDFKKYADIIVNLQMKAVKLFAKWNKTPLDKAMLDALGIYELAKKQYYQLSTGQKRRLHLALALTRDPDILFLDEPTAGLDVEGRLSLHKLIRQLKAMGKTIILASHDMAEVENLCDRIAILSEGKIAFIGTVEQLGETVGKHYNITIQTESDSKKI